MKLIAGEKILRGDYIAIGDDGKAYRCRFNKENLPILFARNDYNKGDTFDGKIPPIAEKEKRGEKVKIPPSEIYVQELTSNVELNIPSVN